MAKMNAALLAFNRGVVSPKSLARVDLERLRLSAEMQTNWMPKAQGAMSLRPGLEYMGSSRNNSPAKWIEFIAATDDVAVVELTSNVARFWTPDGIIERETVATTISNSNFSSATGWTAVETGGADVTFDAAAGLVLNAISRGGVAKCQRAVTVSGGSLNIEHALRIIVPRGPVTFRCGQSSGADDYIRETTLKTGYHSLAFTPVGTFHLTFMTTEARNAIVSSCSIEADGVLEIPTPWAAADLPALRWDQSADVVFVACAGVRQQRIERRSRRSWSIVNYSPPDGPFIPTPTSSVRLWPTATTGNTTLNSDQPFFRPDHGGSIFELFHTGYNMTFTLGAANQYTDAIRVSGMCEEATVRNYSDRVWIYTVTGTWSGTIRCERAFGDEEAGYKPFRKSGSSTDVDMTSNESNNNSDTENNTIVYYRIGFPPGGYTSGTATVNLRYDGGGGTGRCRVVSYVSPTQVEIEVLEPFKNLELTDNWREGSWSEIRGYPSAVCLYEGRLWWAGGAEYNGSISDDYESFDETVEGDAGPISRSIGRGPVDRVNWILPLQRLMLGTVGAEISVKSSSFDEPLTPTNNSGKECSTQGSALLRAVKVDTRGIYVQRSGQRVYQLVFDTSSYDYRSDELTRLSPDICAAGVRDILVQRQPDTRIHCILNDGTVAVFMHDPADEVACWFKIETAGYVEAGFVLPDSNEDVVYYHVRRVRNGASYRYLERLALESQCVGGTINRQADCFKVFEGAVSGSISVPQLAGQAVVVWGDGKDLGDFQVPLNGILQFNGSVTNGLVIGLAYTARFKSTKLAYAAQMGTALTQTKKITKFGAIMMNTHYQGLRYGQSFDVMDDLPRIEDGAETAADTVWADYDAPMFAFPGEWDTDARLCLEAQAPRPCTLLAVVVGIETHEK